ncbi:MAG: HAD family hydrolase [Candidatus Neomarinimicrobiota bacterium]
MNKNIIAMWSGPRNLSTAMMRSFENREDTIVFDEPFYAHYLSVTELNHPGRDEILDFQSTNWNEVVEKCTNTSFHKKNLCYQKHMAQHNLQGFDISWIKNVQNCILIRDPKYVIASYEKKIPVEDERHLGYIQQAEIIEFLEKERGITPPIIDADDILKNPESMMKKLCNVLDIVFYKSMLSWPSGARDSDGVWGAYWYEGVYESTGFKPYTKKEVNLDQKLADVYEKCKKHYDSFYEKRIKL